MEKPTILHSSSSPVPLPHPFPAKMLHFNLKLSWKPSHKISASRRDGFDYEGKSVDENMVVLRKRIQEMKMTEENYEYPTEWMEWEKQYYPEYNSHVCEAVGFLQSALMNTRPSLALGLLALFMLCVPTSVLIIMLHLWGCLAAHIPSLL